MKTEKRLIDATPDDCIKKVKRKTNFAKIIVSGTAEKPYYDIMWFDYIDRQYHIGYGSYNLNFAFQWLAECFEVEDAPAVDAVEVVHGNWNIRCETHRDYHTGEVDEDFYLECSECHRKVWDVSQDDVLLGRYGKICNDYPYCHCGAKMDGGVET